MALNLWYSCFCSLCLLLLCYVSFVSSMWKIQGFRKSLIFIDLGDSISIIVAEVDKSLLVFRFKVGKFDWNWVIRTCLAQICEEVSAEMTLPVNDIWKLFCVWGKASIDLCRKWKPHEDMRNVQYFIQKSRFKES